MVVVVVVAVVSSSRIMVMVVIVVVVVMFVFPGMPLLTFLLSVGCVRSGQQSVFSDVTSWHGRFIGMWNFPRSCCHNRLGYA